MLLSMKMRVVIFGVLCFLHPTLLYASQPPAGVGEVVTEMGIFDTMYPAGKWQEAYSSLEKMEKIIGGIFVQAQLDDFVLEEALAKLKKQVEEQKVAEVKTAYIAFQKQYFNFVSHFDYTVHPILTRIEHLILVGSVKALAREDYVGVRREMDLAVTLVEHGKAVFEKKAISEAEINKFKSKGIALDLAGTKEDHALMANLFEQMKDTYSSFISRYKE